MERVELSHAAAHLADLVDRASNGEDIEIVLDGGVAARLTAIRKLIPPENPQAFDWDAVREMTAKMAPQTESAGDFFRRMRDESPY
jgi:antitoxin (DNA-binding transcriptional repressor) of toxin-antitoxin stability system